MYVIKADILTAHRGVYTSILKILLTLTSQYRNLTNRVNHGESQLFFYSFFSLVKLDHTVNLTVHSYCGHPMGIIKHFTDKLSCSCISGQGLLKLHHWELSYE